MTSILVACGSAFWLGVLTSVSPCLMATNFAAISFLVRRAAVPRTVALSCACYIAGQALAFVLLAVLLVGSLLSVPTVSLWLQKYMFRLLGPVLLLCALILFDLIILQFGSGRMRSWAQSRAGAGGLWASGLLGIVFAMSFCPTTAALYFGSLLPLATANESTLLLPGIYAVGVAVPVVAVSLLVTLAANSVGSTFTRVKQAEHWARRATATVFLLIGLYFTLRYTLELI